MFRLKLIFIIGGGFLAYFGIQEYRVSAGSSNEPAAVELATLEGGDKVPHNHVKLGEHIAVHGAAVYEYRQRKGDNRPPGSSTKVTHVFFPVISQEHEFFDGLNTLAEKYGNLDDAPDSEWPDIDNFSVIVKTKKFKTIGQIPDGLSPVDSTQGLVINLIGGMDKDEKRLLHSSFPKTDLDNVIVIEEGRKPASLVKSLGCALGGILLSVIGVGSFFVGGDD